MLRNASLLTVLMTTLAAGAACDNAKDAKPAKADKKADAKKADKKADAKQADAKADAKTADAKADTKADPKAPDAGGAKVTDFDEATRKKLLADAAKVKEHLTTAREKSKAGEHKAAADAYAKAVALDHDNPRMLEELGWAQFNAEDYKGSEHNIRLALRYSQSNVQRADLLYKLGRIEEQRGDYVKAKEHYDHSLKIKETPDAKEHDDGVGAKAEAACKGGKCSKPDFDDLAAACAAMVARVQEQQGLEPHSADDEFTCDPKAAKTVKLEGGDATEGAILVVKGEHAGNKEEEHDLLAHIEGGWHWVGTILDLENPHDGSVKRSGTIKSFEAKELMPESPGTELLAVVEFKESDADLDDNIIYHDEHDAYLVCGINKGKHACYEIASRMKYVAEALDPKAPTAHDLTSHEFTATVVFDGKGGVTVSGTGEIPESEKGTHKITEMVEPEGFVFLHED